MGLAAGADTVRRCDNNTFANFANNDGGIYICAPRPGGLISWSRASGLRISKDEVSRIAGLLDEQVQAFRPALEAAAPYLFVDAKIEKVRDGGRVQRRAVVVAHAVHETGPREIIGLEIGAAETEAVWTEIPRSLVARGLVGVQLAISDAHPRLKAALDKVLGAPWQRCTVHVMRDLRGHVRNDQHDALGAFIRSIFTAPTAARPEPGWPTPPPTANESTCQHTRAVWAPLCTFTSPTRAAGAPECVRLLLWTSPSCVVFEVVFARPGARDLTAIAPVAPRERVGDASPRTLRPVTGPATEDRPSHRTGGKP